MNTIERKKEDCRVFAYFGSGLGLGIPTVFLLIYHLSVHSLSGNANLTTGLLIILIILTFLPLLFHMLYDTHPNHQVKIDYGLYIIGSLTVILTALTVFFTGGMESSLLSFYFLFIPSAIAISFEANISLKLVCFLGCLSVILLFLFAPDNGTIYNDITYKIFYCLIIILQFVSIYLLELKSKSRRYETK
jgi:hypothetical protein